MKPRKRSLTDSGQSALLRWELAAIGLAMLVLVSVALLPERQAEMGAGRMVVYGSLILLGALLVSFWVFRGRTLARRLQTAETDLEQMQERMAAIFRLSHRFALAQDEAAVIEIVLQMCVDVVKVTGASFVPLDDRKHPLSPQIKGDFSGSDLEVWAEHLAAPQVRDQCAACQAHQANRQDPCPLMMDISSSEVEGIYCFPLQRGDQALGMLNLYMAGGLALDPEALAFLAAMMDEMGIAIEAVRLRDRELATIYSLEALEKTDRDDLLRTMVESLIQATGVSFAHICVYKNEGCSRELQLTVGDPPADVRQYLEVQALNHLNDILVTSTGFPDQLEGISALMICPLMLPDRAMVGTLALARTDDALYSDASVVIIRTVADQIALTARYTQMVQTVEYQAVMAERARLAREIHDGVAQTLGFLKLLAAQLENNLAKGETTRINQLMQMSRSTLAEAYVDARQAIDGLRITPVNGFGSWVQQAAEDFSLNSEMPVSVETEDFPTSVPQEVQAQLIRIVQEALTNIRKHAGANQVWIQGGLWHGDLVLEVRDNGDGFEPGDVIRPSRHGLNGMQERAELIEAEFQIISQPGKGTTVRVRLPAFMEELSS